jgi:hypothetical protein
MRRRDKASAIDGVTGRARPPRLVSMTSILTWSHRSLTIALISMEGASRAVVGPAPVAAGGQEEAAVAVEAAVEAAAAAATVLEVLRRGGLGVMEAARNVRSVRRSHRSRSSSGGGVISSPSRWLCSTTLTTWMSSRHHQRTYHRLRWQRRRPNHQCHHTVVAAVNRHHSAWITVAVAETFRAVAAGADRHQAVDREAWGSRRRI